MADGAQFDFSGLNRLVGDLGKIDSGILPNARKAVMGAALNIKDDWQELAAKANPSHAKRYPKSIDFDIFNKVGAIRAEIGPNLGRSQGSLGGLLEDAPGDVRSAPQKSHEKALRNNLADFERGILKAAGEWLA